jgi:glycine dehydrogenase subunit 1
MNFSPHTHSQIKEMLEVIGESSVWDLFRDIPVALKPKSFDLPDGVSEQQVFEYFKELSLKNANSMISFLGAGFYEHYIPAVVDALSNRAEFYTAYTPYQPEASQGWLQAIYEYQSAICALTGLDVSNASLYDGGTALYEAAMMAIRITGKNKIIMDSGLNYIYRNMLYSYTKNLSVEFIETAVIHGQSSREEIYKYLDDKTAAVILQNPNFFGAIDDHTDVVEKVHAAGALAIASAYPVSLGLLKTPGEQGFDIATGEGQSLGLPLSFGGPYLGFICAKKEFVRSMPGRIVGETVDKDGRQGFVLTLQTREQHIRREKATSNICSNEALCALKALIYLSALGKAGFKELAELNFGLAEFAKGLLDEIPGVSVKRSSPTFNEFTVVLKKDAQEVFTKMIKKGFVCGFPLGKVYKGMDNYLLVCVTEKRTKNEIIDFAGALKEVLCS